MIKIDYSINESDGHYMLTVGGEVDASSSIHLETALREAMDGHKKILVDLGELDYISSAGLGVFMSVIQKIENEKIQLVLFNLKEKVLEVFDILGLTQLINVKKTLEEALEAIN